MSKKVLTGAMAALMATGVVTPAMAGTTNVTELHKAAFEAMQKAEAEKTQLSINEAREALRVFADAMPGHADISTWSTRLDHVQQPIFADIVERLVTLQAEGAEVSQDAVNAIYELIFNDESSDLDDVPSEYKDGANYGWTEQTDKLQEKLNKAAATAYEAAKAAIAEAETAEEIEAAKELVAAAEAQIASLKTAYREVVRVEGARIEGLLATEVETLTEKEEALNRYDLTVTEFVINRGFVEVTFEALTEELTDVKVEVVDNKGNIVEVEAIELIDQGETTAVFNFVNMLTADAEGTWTVNGLAINLDEVNFVATVKATIDASTTTADAYKLLNDSEYFTGLVNKDANIKAYIALIDEKSEEIETIADIQAIIEAGNKNVENAEKIENLVYVAKNGTATQFKNALNSLGFERVNADWMNNYQEAIKNLDEATFTDVQSAINLANYYAIGAEKSKADTIAKKQAVLTLIDKYVKAEKKEDVEAVAAAVKTIKTDIVLLKINDAKTNATVKNALKELSDVVADKTKFSYEELVNENLMAEYKVALSGKGFTKVEAVVGKIIEVGKDAADEQVSKVVTAANALYNAVEKEEATKRAELVKALEKLVTISAKNKEKFEMEDVSTALLDEYANGIYLTSSPITDVASLNKAIATVNENAVKSIMGDAREETILQKLNHAHLGLTNVVTANEKAYALQVTSFQALTTAKDVSKLVDTVNNKVVILTSSDVATVKASLIAYALNEKLEDVINLKDAQKTDLAQLLIAKLAEDKDTAEEDKKIAYLNDKIKEAEDVRYGLMKKLNTVDLSISNAVAALEQVSSEFKALDSANKLVVAEKFLDARTKSTNVNGTVIVGLNSFADVVTLLNSVK